MVDWFSLFNLWIFFHFHKSNPKTFASRKSSNWTKFKTWSIFLV